MDDRPHLANHRMIETPFTWGKYSVSIDCMVINCSSGSLSGLDLEIQIVIRDTFIIFAVAGYRSR